MKHPALWLSCTSSRSSFSAARGVLVPWQSQWIFTHSWAQIWRIRHKMVSSWPCFRPHLNCHAPPEQQAGSLVLGPDQWVPAFGWHFEAKCQSQLNIPPSLSVRPFVAFLFYFIFFYILLLHFLANGFSLERLSRWCWLTGVSVSG